MTTACAGGPVRSDDERYHYLPMMPADKVSSRKFGGRKDHDRCSTCVVIYPTWYVFHGVAIGDEDGTLFPRPPSNLSAAILLVNLSSLHFQGNLIDRLSAAAARDGA